MESKDNWIFVATLVAIAGAMAGTWGVFYVATDESRKAGVEKGRQQVQDDAIAFGAAHRTPKGAFVWGPVTKRELEAAR